MFGFWHVHWELDSLSLPMHFRDGHAHKATIIARRKAKASAWPLMAACSCIPHPAHVLVFFFFFWVTFTQEHLMLSIPIAWVSSCAWSNCCSSPELLPFLMLLHQEGKCSPTSLLSSGPHHLSGCFVSCVTAVFGTTSNSASTFPIALFWPLCYPF